MKKLRQSRPWSFFLTNIFVFNQADGAVAKQSQERVTQRPPKIVVHLPFGPGHRGELAVLLQGPPGRPRQRGGPHRQAEHPGGGALRLVIPGGAPEPPGRNRSGPSHRRYPADGPGIEPFTA